MGIKIYLSILHNNQTRFKNISHCWTLCWFIPTAPVVHRSALYELVNSNTDEDNATFKEIVEEPAFPAHSESESLGGGGRKETRKKYDSTISCTWGELSTT